MPTRYDKDMSDVISEAFRNLLPHDPSDGTMIYTRFFPLDVLEGLSEDSPRVTGWDVFIVSNRVDRTPSVIPADRAVEIREDKGHPTLLLVDPFSVGAGMDGIYSAAREISESLFYDKAHRIAISRMSVSAQVVNYAVAQSKKLGDVISPFKVLEFYVAGARNSEAFGRSLGHLGIWPLMFEGRPSRHEIDRGVRMTEQLLIDVRAQRSATGRVDSLGLDNPTQDQIRELTALARDAERKSFREITESVMDIRHVWLGQIVPKVLDDDRLVDIKLTPWRVARGKLAKWSGLVDLGGRPTFIVDKSEDGRDTRMEVRWVVTPSTLATGSAEYVVEVVSGEDVLATRLITHRANAPTQKCVLTTDDFDIEEGSKFEAEIRVHSGDCEDKSQEDFILVTGDPKQPAQTRKTHRERTVIDGLARLDVDAFLEMVRSYGEPGIYEASKDSVSVRAPGNQSTVITVPPLMKLIEDDWRERNGDIGYWTVKTFFDGRLSGSLTFVPFCDDALGSSAQRLRQVTRQFQERLSRGPGLFAWINHAGVDASDYLNACIQALEGGSPHLARVFTVEVCDLDGRPIGIIVPMPHPIRLAWQSAYDGLVQHERFEAGTALTDLSQALNGLDGAYFPMFLPKDNGGEGAWVFGDSLDFHAVAMVSTEDPEPKSSVARLARAWFGSHYVSVEERGVSETLRDELRRYRILHPAYGGLHVHGVKVGDASHVVAALGPDPEGEFPNEESFRYEFEVFPADASDDMAGARLAEIMKRQRSGGAVSDNLKWMLETVDRGGRLIPRFQWSRKSSIPPEDSAHVTVAFNLFGSAVELLPRRDMPTGTTLLYGLAQTLDRRMAEGNKLVWHLSVPPSLEGRKHPAAGRLTDRLTRLQMLMAEKTVLSLGGNRHEDWPVLVTSLDADAKELLTTLHRTSDWVVTFDRNIGFEYFDNPRAFRDVYDLYIIDCVPERGDFNALQMVTSTIHVDEVLYLLDKLLNELDLSRSVRNRRQILDNLKMVSGRLAMRLSGQGLATQEAIGLSLVVDQCLKSGSHPWLSLEDGFFIPLDEIPEIFGAGHGRSDFIYVTCPRSRGGSLEFRFVEVKFRRYRNTARSAQLIAEAERQLADSRKRWADVFGYEKPTLPRAVSHIRLAHILQFYLDKAHRHALADDTHQRIQRELHLVLKDPEYKIVVNPDGRGFVFCPEYLGNSATPLTPERTVWLFGPNEGRRADVCSPPLELPKASAINHPVVTDNGNRFAAGQGDVAHPVEEILVHVGEDKYSVPVSWPVSIKGNPHLLMVGLPGMGKTTALINICRQLRQGGACPVIFSYHEDIDMALNQLWGDAVQFLDFGSVGFDAMAVSAGNPYGYVDNAGALRDIFSGIFPDLGEVQLAAVRDAISDAYREYGWGPGLTGDVPPFRRFWEILQANPRADAKLLTRLRELDDYGMFDSRAQGRSILGVDKPTVIRLHTTQNEVIQRAFAIFLIYRIYQEMFSRGIQGRITHALVVDEAHRASKLKLLPRVAKECRKYGIAMLMASQEVQDFDDSLIQAMGTYVALRVGEADSKGIARYMAPGDQVKIMVDALKTLPKFEAYFFTEGYKVGQHIRLADPPVP